MPFMTAYAIHRYRTSCFSCLYWDNDSCMFSSCIFIIITCIAFFVFVQNWSIIVDLNNGYIKQIYFSFWFIVISKKWNRQSTVSLCAKLLIFVTVQQASHSHWNESNCDQMEKVVILKNCIVIVLREDTETALFRFNLIQPWNGAIIEVWK